MTNAKNVGFISKDNIIMNILFKLITKYIGFGSGHGFKLNKTKLFKLLKISIKWSWIYILVWSEFGSAQVGLFPNPNANQIKHKLLDIFLYLKTTKVCKPTLNNKIRRRK